MDIDMFCEKRILVIGDVMLDKSIWGNVARISPEAPVQVVDVTRESYAPGGAANVANNIAALGGEVYVCGIVGDDAAKDVLLAEFGKRGISTEGILVDKGRPTIQKVRIMGHSQQLLRVDYEDRNQIGAKVEARMLEIIRKIIAKVDCIVVSDYAKGLVTAGIMDAIRKAGGLPVIVDPKPLNAEYYRGVTLITPNQKEAFEMHGQRETHIDAVGKGLVRKLSSNVLITRGEQGMSLYCLDGSRLHIPTRAKEVYDVTGAGDTAIGTLSLAIASGASFSEAATLANAAAGLTVGKVGASVVTADELKREIEDEGSPD
ncbi:MAG: D-glycero-beta-D-manno-heptose-7-phosphate kinase [archaeon]